MTQSEEAAGMREWTVVFSDYKDTSIGVAYDDKSKPKLFSNMNGIYDVIDKTALLLKDEEIALLRKRVDITEAALKSIAARPCNKKEGCPCCLAVAALKLLSALGADDKMGEKDE